MREAAIQNIGYSIGGRKISNARYANDTSWRECNYAENVLKYSGIAVILVFHDALDQIQFSKHIMMYCDQPCSMQLF